MANQEPGVTVVKWLDLVKMADEELAPLDVAEVNLACAEGLPGSEQIYHEGCIGQLDYFARMVKQETDRLQPQFLRKRYDYKNSIAYFKTLAMITVLQRDLGVRYNPLKIPE